MENEIEVLTTNPEEFINNWVNQHRYCVSWQTAGEEGKNMYSTLSQAEADTIYDHFETIWNHRDEIRSNYPRNDELVKVKLHKWTELQQAEHDEIVELLDSGYEKEAISLMESNYDIYDNAIASKTSYLSKDYEVEFFYLPVVENVETPPPMVIRTGQQGDLDLKFDNVG